MMYKQHTEQGINPVLLNISPNCLLKSLSPFLKNEFWKITKVQPQSAHKMGGQHVKREVLLPSVVIQSALTFTPSLKNKKRNSVNPQPKSVSPRKKTKIFNKGQPRRKPQFQNPISCPITDTHNTPNNHHNKSMPPIQPANQYSKVSTNPPETSNPFKNPLSSNTDPGTQVPPMVNGELLPGPQPGLYYQS